MYNYYHCNFNSLKLINGNWKVTRVKVNPFSSLHAFLWTLLTFSPLPFSKSLYDYSIVEDGKIICSARVAHKNFFFPFMPSKGLHIGPCLTVPECRGKGLYPYILTKIISDFYNSNFYMIVDTSNQSSIKGLSKVGFKIFAKGHKTIFNRYVIDKYI